jgi:hypothetical protein
MSELQLLLDRLKAARCPEDVFGSGDPAAAYRKLARACHPDLHKELLAVEAFQRLTQMKEAAEERRCAGTWGQRLSLPHCAPFDLGAYLVRRNSVKGEIADVYTVVGGSLVVKAARSHEDNDLMRAEAAALIALDAIPTPVVAGVPALKESFAVDGVWKRQANVLTAYPGFVTAEQVRGKMMVDARSLVWIFKRLLAVLSWAHHFGWVHGAILPPHVLFYPDNAGGERRDARKHTVRLIDWCYAVEFKTRTRLSSWSPAWEKLYAPELLSKTSIGPESDLYMAAALMRYLGDKLPPGLEAVLARCQDKNPQRRYEKATHAMEAWQKAALAEYGSPQWHEFNLPET